MQKKGNFNTQNYEEDLTKNYLPDINLHNPYKINSQKENIYTENNREIVDKRPFNQQVMINKYLKNHCNIILIIYNIILDSKITKQF